MLKKLKDFLIKCLSVFTGAIQRLLLLYSLLAMTLCAGLFFIFLFYNNYIPAFLTLAGVVVFMQLNKNL